MNQPMITTGPHSIRVTPQFIDSLLVYPRYYAQKLKDGLAFYDERVPDDEFEIHAIEDARQELARVEMLMQKIEQLRAELERIYDWHFKNLAELFRQVRIDLELEDIRSSYSLRLVLNLFMDMLQGENAWFDRETFINYINNPKEFYDETKKTNTL